MFRNHIFPQKNSVNCTWHFINSVAHHHKSLNSVADSQLKTN